MDKSFLDFKVISIIGTDQIRKQCLGNPNSSVFICGINLNKEAQSFLEKILSAVNLNIKEDIIMLEKTLDNDFSFSSLNKDKKIQKAIFFGLDASTLGLQIDYKKYQPISLNTCSFLFADDLKQIEQDQDLKKKLWSALKDLFL